MERDRDHPPIFAHPNTHDFLVEAIEDGAVGRTLDMYRQTVRLQDKKFRNLNILAIYLGSDASSQEIADIYQIADRRTIPNIVRNTLKDIWSLSSEDLRLRYPLEGLEAAKPLSIKAQVKMSQSKNGLSARVYQLLNSGASYEDIKSQTGASVVELSKIRAVIKRWGIELPHRKSRSERLMDILRTAESDSEIQEALNQINESFYKAHTQQKAEAVLPIYKAARRSGFFFRQDRLTSFIDTLRDARIPLGIWKPKIKGKQVSYYFIAAKHFDRVRQAFESKPNLQVFKESSVKPICGPEGHIPSTNEIVHSGRYKRPGYLFRQAGVPVGKIKDIGYQNFFDTDCPLAVYKFYSTYYFEAAYEEQLRDYLETRARQLGLLG